jgi:hypothetical protein
MIEDKLTNIVHRGGVVAKRLIAPFVAVVLVGCVVGAAPAMAESAWWQLTSSSEPASLAPGGEGTVSVLASNVGDKQVEGGLVTLRDKLPSGLSVRGVSYIAYPVGIGDISGFGFCETTGREVACRFPSEALPINPYEYLEMRVRVKVEGVAQGAENEVSIAGAGVLPASLKRPLDINATPTPYGVEGYTLTPENVAGTPDTQAGSHPFQLTTTLLLNQTAPGTTPAFAKDLHFNLPPGLIGNPTPFPQCTNLQFSTYTNVYNHCPSNTVVGVAMVSVDEPTHFGLVTIPVPLFNLVPAVGEPARFGFEVIADPVILDTAVRTGGDYGVTVSVKNITELADFVANRVTFWGVPGDPRHDSARGWSCISGGRFAAESHLGPCTPLGLHKPPPLLTLPTSCTGPLQTTIETDSWTQPGVFTPPFEALSEPSLDGCNRLPFGASIQVAPDGQAASTPTGLTVGLHVPQEEILNPTGLSPANVKDTTVTLPAGVALNPAAADGLLACSEAQIALEVHSFPTCPEASKVGTDEIKSPLLPNALTGSVYLAAQNANPFGTLVALYLEAQDPVSGTLIKVAGEVKPDPVTGQLVSTFRNTPQLPFEDLKLHFFGGFRAPLNTPVSCGPYTTTASISPWSGNPPVEPTSTFEITSGPNGTPCASPLPFVPSLTAGTTSIQAGGFSPFTMTMSREDGNQNLSAIELRMPPGMSGTLSTVKLCGEAQANAGTCGPESEIGETIVSVGMGGNPFSVKGGKVFITGPYRGAPFGLSIVNPAKAGPFDLGHVIVRAKIEVDPISSALTITSDSEGPYKIPTIIDGIPLQIKHVNVSINRPNFTFNPTNCSPLAITGKLLSVEGASSALSVPFQITNCAVLAFQPKLTAATSGKTSRKLGASLSVKLTYPAGPYDANIAKVKVDLPKQLPSRLTTLQKACPAATFEANPANCPPASIVGQAKASTPVLPVPLSGPAYFVSHGGEEFPTLIIVLQGYGVTVHLLGTTFIDKAGITSSTFKTIPDVPVGTFEMTLPQGPYSALAANGNLCKSKLAMPTAFIGQNGAVIHTSTPIVATGCARHKAKKAHKAHKAHKARRNHKKGK